MNTFNFNTIGELSDAADLFCKVVCNQKKYNEEKDAVTQQIINEVANATLEVLPLAEGEYFDNLITRFGEMVESNNTDKKIKNTCMSALRVRLSRWINSVNEANGTNLKIGLKMATKEVDQYVDIATSGTERILV